MNVEELNKKYQRVQDLHEESFKLLKEYVHGMLTLHGGSIGFKVKEYDECEEKGEEWLDQFPGTIDVDGRHGVFFVNVTKVYTNKDGNIRINGVEIEEWGNEWHEDLYTREDYETYHSLAYFINEVLSRELSNE